MDKIKLTIVIPDYKDPYLNKMIDDILQHSELGNQLEIIPVLDGVWREVIQDPRVVVLHLGKNSGMRRAINAGVRIARGEFILRGDAHCGFAQGFDKVLTDQCPKDAIMTATRYFLDPIKWEKMDIRPMNYEKLIIQDCGNGVKKFAGQRWDSRDKERKDIMIDETMAMQGSMWIMPHAWWDKVIGELQTEGYGPAYQDSHEMIFKTWKAGGKMLLNKNTWFMHKHRSFERSHNEGTPENPWIREKSWAYALKVWGDYYKKEICPKWKL
jgi:glycosyltransferase involved in cell wall biosynthesis